MKSAESGSLAEEAWLCIVVAVNQIAPLANTRLRRGQRPVEVASAQRIQCIDCGRGFSRPGDLKRHKCLAERAKPVEEQSGAEQCEVCKRWFCSRRGLALHKCGDKQT